MFETMRTHAARSLRGGVLALTLGSLVIGGVVAQDATPTVVPGVIDGEPIEIDCTEAGAIATPGGGESAAPAMVYEIDMEQSEVRYLADEELAGQGAVTAIGATRAFIGAIYFDEAGMPLPCSRWDADLRTLQSDSSRRDNYLYNNTLETEKYPLATFILTGVEGLEEPIADGETATFMLVGNLTLHGVTRSVRWQATVTRDGDQMVGSAETTFDMPDFDIVPPKVGPVLSLEEEVRLQVDIVANLKS
jgi:polyisoprenoid-binding protein YceI